MQNFLIQGANMKRTILTILFCLTTTVAYAEPWVCFDDTTKHVTRTYGGDGFKAGICGKNNSNIIPTCILATASEFAKAKTAYQKVDVSIVTGDRVIPLTQAEIDAILQSESDAQKASETATVNSFDITAKDAFIAWIKVYNSKVPAQYQVSKSEMIQQIKADKGL